MIPAEAVEVVARWLYARNDEYGQPAWEDAPRDLIWKAAQDDFRQDARELLEAAAPHMLAAVWDEGEAAGQDNADSNRGYNIEHKYNPYRPTP